MMELSEVNRVVNKAASAALKNAGLSRVYSEPATDSDGREALNVTIVLRGNEKDELTGDAALDAIVRIRQDLLNFGEERFPIVDFATEEELKQEKDELD